MSSMTIDQLKKSLTEQGITLPPSRSKKADYIKLYKQYSTMNDSLGDVYGSDDENPPKTGSQSVTSSTSPGRNDISKEVELLSDDELYNQLKEFDANIGPVLKNTRRVYEKKLIKILSGTKGIGGHETKTIKENQFPSAEEFSDSDVEIISKSPKRSELNTRKSSILRDSPKPSLPESSEPDVEKTYFSGYAYSTNRSSTPSYTSEPKPSRYSYIETIPKGSSYGYIEQAPEIGFNNYARQRFTDKYKMDKFSSDPLGSEKYGISKSTEEEFTKHKIDVDQFKPSLESQYKFGMKAEDQFKSGFNMGGQYKPSSGIINKNKLAGSGGIGRENYIGSWEPNINRYLNTGTQKKVSSSAENSHPGLLKNILAGLLLLVILIVFIYLCQQWLTTDPYKMIEDDAERTIQQLQQDSNEY